MKKLKRPPQEERMGSFRKPDVAGKPMRSMSEMVAAFLKEEDMSEAERLMDAIIERGLPALPELYRIYQSEATETDRQSVLELIAEIKLRDLESRKALGDPRVVGDIVSHFVNLETGDAITEKLRRMLVNELGIQAIPELIRLSETSEDPETATCSMLFISELVSLNPGRKELLEAVPMLIRHVERLRDADIGMAGYSLLGDGRLNIDILRFRAIYPELWAADCAIGLLGDLWKMFPGEGSIQSSIFALLDKGDTGDPLLNQLIYKTISDIGGFSPPLSKGDKIKN